MALSKGVKDRNSIEPKNYCFFSDSFPFISNYICFVFLFDVKGFWQPLYLVVPFCLEFPRSRNGCM